MDLNSETTLHRQSQTSSTSRAMGHNGKILFAQIAHHLVVNDFERELLGGGDASQVIVFRRRSIKIAAPVTEFLPHVAPSRSAASA
jgi:hypothetical protein